MAELAFKFLSAESEAAILLVCSPKPSGGTGLFPRTQPFVYVLFEALFSAMEGNLGTPFQAGGQF